MSGFFRLVYKYILGVAAVLLLVVAGTALPGKLMTGRDRMILGQVHSEVLDEAEMSDYVNISMVEKVGLLGMSGGITLVPLETGAVYDSDTIRAKFVEEFDRLHVLQICPRPSSGEMSGFRSAATLHIMNDAPAINMIVWEISVRMDTIAGTYILDDQTGKILSFDIVGTGFGELVYTDETVGSWAVYLGTDVKNTRHEAGDRNEAVYEFELTSGANAVSCRLAGAISDDNDDNENRRWSLVYTQVTDGRLMADYQ